MANEEVMNEMDMENEGTLITLEDEDLLDKRFDIFKKKYEGEINFE